MSRSHKKSPWVVDKKSKFAKRQANKKVRNTKVVPNGKAFKKVYESWDISDYKYRIDIKDKTGFYYPLYKYLIK